MKLTCPECTTQFAINPEVIGSNGRTVRCSQCSATWFAAADPDVLDLHDHLAGVQAQKEAGFGHADDFAAVESVSKEGQHGHEPALESSVFENSVLENAGPGLVDETVNTSSAPHVMMRDRAERKKVRRRLLSVSMIWGVTFFILAAAALTAYMLRVPISKKFPVTQGMYEAFGITIPVVDLEINLIGHSFDEQQILTVSGKVKNSDTKTRDVPLVKLSFLDGAGAVLASWVVEPERSILKSGESVSFETQYPNPPAGAVNLVTSFVSETGDDSVVVTDEIPVIME